MINPTLTSPRPESPAESGETADDAKSTRSLSSEQILEALVARGIVSRELLRSLVTETQPQPRAVVQVRSADDPSTPALEATDALGNTMIGAQSEDGIPHLESTPMIDGKLRYELRKELAAGGLGRVWLARDQHIARDVAIKEVLPGVQSAEARQRFLQEAQITGQLEHPGIVPVYELGMKPDGEPFYSMKLLRGKTLADSIDFYHQLPPNDERRTMLRSELLRVFVDVCNAIAYAHNKGVLHRDLKPANVMVGDFGEAIVVDWGLATPLREGPRNRPRPSNDATAVPVEITLRDGSLKTVDGTVMGTPNYMSPEQAVGLIDELDERSDIFALGGVLYEILTGQTPFQGETAQEVLMNVVSGNLVPPTLAAVNVPPALNAICLKAMSIALDERYQSAKELAADIERWRAGEPVLAYPDPLIARLYRFVRKHRTAFQTTAAAAAVLAAGLGFWSVNERQRIQRVSGEVWSLVMAGQKSIAGGNLDDARVELARAKTLLETAPSLTFLNEEVQLYLGRADALIRERDDRESSRSKYERFIARRDDALFHGTLFTGLDPAHDVAQTQQACQDALAQFSRDAEHGYPLNLSAEHLSEKEKSEVALDRIELLMLWAEAASFAAPDAPHEEKIKSADEALRILELVIDSHSPFRAWRLRRAKYLAQADRAAESNAELSKAGKIEASTALDYFLLGDEAYKQEDFNAAKEWFDRALGIDPDRFWALYFRGLCAFKLGQYGNAEAYFTSCIHQRPEFVWNYVLRGVANFSDQDEANGEIDFQKAVLLNPNEPAIFVNRGACRLEAGRTDEAIEDFRKAISLRPDLHDARLNLAVALREKGKFADALQELNETLKIARWSPKAYYHRGSLYLKQNDLDRADADFSLAARFGAKGSYVREMANGERSRILHRQGRHAEAIAIFRESLKESKGGSEVHRLMAESLMALGKYDEAVDLLDDLIEDGAKVADIHQARAFARRKSGDVRGAVEDYTLSIAIDPKVANVYTRRGWEYALRWRDLAMADFEDAIRHNPNDPDNYNGRGFLLALSRDNDRAIADAEKSLTLAGKSPEMVYNAAAIFATVSGNRRSEGVIAAKPADQLAGRAVDLIRQSLALFPPPQRKPFLKAVVLTDPATEPIRSTPPFVELLREYGL